MVFVSQLDFLKCRHGLSILRNLCKHRSLVGYVVEAPDFVNILVEQVRIDSERMHYVKKLNRGGREPKHVVIFSKPVLYIEKTESETNILCDPQEV
jgi:hypothetical protein